MIESAMGWTALLWRAPNLLGGLFTVGTLWLVSIDSFAMHAVFTGLLTWVVVAAATIVFDLDDPYTGDFIVDWTRFRALADRMKR